MDVGTMVGRMRLLYPVLRAAAVDAALRQLILSELVQQIINEGGAIVLLRGMRIHPCDTVKWVEYKDELSGLTAENII